MCSPTCWCSRAREGSTRTARSCTSTGAALWGARLVLLIARRPPHRRGGSADPARSRRPGRSATRADASPQVSTLASRTIRWGGALILVFLVYHILHFTTGTAASRLRRAESVSQRVDRLPEPLGRAVLPRRHGRRRPPPVSRDLEQRPQPGPQRAVPAAAQAAPGGWSLAVFVWLGFTAIVVAVLMGRRGVMTKLRGDWPPAT